MEHAYTDRVLKIDCQVINQLINAESAHKERKLVNLGLSNQTEYAFLVLTNTRAGSGDETIIGKGFRALDLTHDGNLPKVENTCKPWL